MTLVMGILNVTPDSFSDGGRFVDPGAAIAHARRLRLQGADIIDIGGESTRPGANPVSAAQEQQRVLPVIEALAREGFRISIDTVHAATAQAAVAAGATIVNDVSGGVHDAALLDTVAAAGVHVVLMHSRGMDVTKHTEYTNVVTDVCQELRERIAAAIAAGVRRDRIIVDPGFGFSKNDADNWTLLAHLDAVSALGYPVLVGASRKRFLGSLVSADSSMEARDAGSAAVSVLAAQAGAWAVRVHDVAATRRSLDVVAAAAAAASPRTVGNDHIRLTGLRAFAHHGVFEHERVDGQSFVIDVDVEIAAGIAGAVDALDRTVHYGELALDVVAAVERDPVDLIETVAERVAHVALARPHAERVSVTVHKPEAPITVPFDDVSITIERVRA